MTNYLKTYVKLLIMMLFLGKGLLLATLILMHVVLTDISYRAFFHKVDLRQMRFRGTLCVLGSVILLLALAGIAVYLLTIYYYWEDVIELIEMALVHMVAIMAYFFIIMSGLAWRKRIFSGCTYLNRERKTKVVSVRKRLMAAHFCLFADFLSCLFLIWDGDFRTVDLTRYITGTGVVSKDLIIRPKTLCRIICEPNDIRVHPSFALLR